MKADKVIGLILIAFSIFMYVQADRLPPALFGTLGAGFVPKILFIILAGCGAVLTIQCLIRERKIKAAGVELPEDEGEPADSQFKVKEFLKYYQYVIKARRRLVSPRGPRMTPNIAGASGNLNLNIR